MTNKELGDYFKRLAKVYINQGKGSDMKGLIESALITGREDFWGAVPWAFKEKHTTVTASASSETVDLPDDFEGLVSVIERDSSNGFKLQKFGSDEYDRLVPYSSGLSENTPDIYKVYFDGEEGVWRLALYPTPSSATTLYLTYHTVEDGGRIPKKYIGGLVAGIAQYLFIPGSAEWNGAHTAFLSQIERLRMIDNPDVESLSRFLDNGDGPVTWEFEEYMAGRT